MMEVFVSYLIFWLATGLLAFFVFRDNGGDDGEEGL